MTYQLDPAPLVLVALLSPLPIGLLIAIRYRRKTWCRALGVGMVTMSVSVNLVLCPFIVWGLDALRGWSLSVPVDIPGYRVCLIQRPGDDFYESYFEITRADGKTATVYIDGDDYRWWNPGVVEEDGVIYFTRGFGMIGERTSYVDPTKDTIYSGYYQRTFNLSELEFD